MHERESESEVTQLCLTLSDPVDRSLPGSSIHGIFEGESTGVGCHCLLCNRILLSLKKARNLVIYNNMDEPKGHYAD